MFFVVELLVGVLEPTIILGETNILMGLGAYENKINAILQISKFYSKIPKRWGCLDWAPAALPPALEAKINDF